MSPVSRGHARGVVFCKKTKFVLDKSVQMLYYMQVSASKTYGEVA